MAKLTDRPLYPRWAQIAGWAFWIIGIPAALAFVVFFAWVLWALRS